MCPGRSVRTLLGHQPTSALKPNPQALEVAMVLVSRVG